MINNKGVLNPDVHLLSHQWIQLQESFTCTQLVQPSYMHQTTLIIHSSTPAFLRAHQITFLGTWSNAFSRSTKANQRSLPFAMYFSCNCLRMKKAFVLPRPGRKPNCIDVNNIPDQDFHDTLKNFHGIFNQFNHFHASCEKTVSCHPSLHYESVISLCARDTWGLNKVSRHIPP